MRTSALFKKNVRLNGSLLLFFAFFVITAKSQSPNLRYLGIEKGLSNNSVRAIYQDHNGFLWFGTYDGLNRYDGYEFTVFRNKLDDSTSLPYNYINVISEDKEHNLWVGTGQGIGIYNNLSAKWQAASYLPFGQTIKERLSDNINHIETDPAGNVLIGTANHGFLIRYAQKDAAVQVPLKRGGREATAYNVQAIQPTTGGRVWLFVEEVGLCVYEMKTRQIRVVDASQRSIQCLRLANGRIWLGTKSGLFVYDTATGKASRFQTKEGTKLASLNITSLYLDKQQKMWIGTEGDGVLIVNTATGDLASIQPGSEGTNMTSGSVNVIFEDRETRKWIGTLKGGINIIDPEESKFQTITHGQRNPNSLVNDFVYSFYEDKDSNLWIGTDGGGFSIWNRKKNKFINYWHDEKVPQSLSNNSVTGILQDHLNNTWIATFGGGINKFSPATGLFEHYPCINDRTGEVDKIVMVLYEDREKHFWAGTFSNGKLYRFNRTANRFEVFDQNLANLLTMAEDRNGALWLGNTSQLIRLDKGQKRHQVFAFNKPVRAIHEDKKGNFWVGTEGGGLILFDRKEGKIKRRFSVENGLCNNSILKILEDDNGQLWLSTFNGLSKFNPSENTFKNYYQSDGLQSNQFLFRSGLRLQSGEFVFGGIRGFNLFYPDSIRPRNYMPPLMLTNVRINGKPVADAYDYVVKTAGDKVEALRIPYDEAVLSVDFTALEYSSPDQIAYAYYLEGWDKDWNYSRNVRTANYSNLREGTYYLRLKASNAEGVWSGQERVLKITVLPPWFRTVWAYLLYLVLVATLVYIYLRYKTRQTRLEYEVKLARIDAEKEKELHEKKLAFFTNVSHEFRTPLTLIINPLKDYLSSAEKTGDKTLQVVYRNARRLLSLVDQLLLFQKADTERENLYVGKLDMIRLCREVFGNFEMGARARRLRYEFVFSSEEIWLYADKEKMEIILYNLLSNALKYTPEGGEILFRVQEGSDRVEITIEDSGPGIPASAREQLFQRFHQVQTAKAASQPGFGIGLYLVKHFVEKHKGSIVYADRQGGGASFLLSFQKGDSHLGEYPFVDEAPEQTLLPELVQEELPGSVKGTKELPEIVSDKNAILVVEDEEEIRAYIAGIFRDDYTIYEAKNGQEGLQKAKDLLPDMIISDVMMQNGSGIELCAAIKNDPQTSHIPVVLLTAVSSTDVKLKGVEGGADDYITKPFEKELLVARVASLLKARTALQQYFYNEVTLRKNDLKISLEYKAFLEKCMAIVEAHLEDDDFSVKKLTQEIGMSHSNLYKKVKAISGQSVSAFIRYIRVRKAAELMLKSGMNVNEASFQVGISDVKYFRKQFQKLFGMNPSDYIKKYRPGFSDAYLVSIDLVNPEN